MRETWLSKVRLAANDARAALGAVIVSDSLFQSKESAGSGRDLRSLPVAQSSHFRHGEKTGNASKMRRAADLVGGIGSRDSLRLWWEFKVCGFALLDSEGIEGSSTLQWWFVVLCGSRFTAR
jgi:hypothetical protein